MKVCLIGSGGREHALAESLSLTADVIATPGNPGMDFTSESGFSCCSTCKAPVEIEADLYVVGPEQPLVEGLADRLRAMGRKVCGPGQSGALLEGSKTFMKDLALRAGVPSARYASFSDVTQALSFLATMSPPYVIKTDGLAGGKGVLVTESLERAQQDVIAKLSGSLFGEAGSQIVIEEGIVGEELSLLVLTDGKRTFPLPAAQDFKRAHDGDKGPNTGGMGAFSPVPRATDQLIGTVMDTIIEPTLRELGHRGVDYRGVLYAGLMLCDSGPRLIEYNVRFGDPEAEVVLPRLKGDLAATLLRVAEGHLATDLVVREEAAVCVVAASEGYPDEPRRGDLIDGVADANSIEGVTVFHSGTGRSDSGGLVTTGGRVFAVTGVAESLRGARDVAYRGIGEISFPGMQYRSDIAAAASNSDPGEQ